jgi:hypothetical protein
MEKKNMNRIIGILFIILLIITFGYYSQIYENFDQKNYGNFENLLEIKTNNLNAGETSIKGYNIQQLIRQKADGLYIFIFILILIIILSIAYITYYIFDGRTLDDMIKDTSKMVNFILEPPITFISNIIENTPLLYIEILKFFQEEFLNIITYIFTYKDKCLWSDLLWAIKNISIGQFILVSSTIYNFFKQIDNRKWMVLFIILFSIITIFLLLFNFNSISMYIFIILNIISFIMLGYLIFSKKQAISFINFIISCFTLNNISYLSFILSFTVVLIAIKYFRNYWYIPFITMILSIISFIFVKK